MTSAVRRRASRYESLLVYRIFECFASAELRHFGRLDLDGVTGAWVTTLSRGALANIERAKANECDDVALLQRISDRVHRRVQRASGRRFGDVSMLGDRVDQF